MYPHERSLVEEMKCFAGVAAVMQRWHGAESVALIAEAYMTNGLDV